MENGNILTDAIYASEVMPVDRAIADRRQERRQWFDTVQQTLADADLVFVDPDNGLEPDGYRHGSIKAGKSILVDELLELAKPGRCLIVYHHQTRMEGGHQGEIDPTADARLERVPRPN